MLKTTAATLKEAETPFFSLFSSSSHICIPCHTPQYHKPHHLHSMSTPLQHQYIVTLGQGSLAIFHDSLSKEVLTHEQLKVVITWTECYKWNQDHTKCSHIPVGTLFVSQVINMCPTMPGSMLKFIGSDFDTMDIRIVTTCTPMVDEIMGSDNSSHKRPHSDDDTPNINSKQMAFANKLVWKEVKRNERLKERRLQEKKWKELRKKAMAKWSHPGPSSAQDTSGGAQMDVDSTPGTRSVSSTSVGMSADVPVGASAGNSVLGTANCPTSTASSTATRKTNKGKAD